MKCLVSPAVVGVSWCKECDYVIFEVVHLTHQLAYGSFLPLSQRSTSKLQQSEQKTNQSILRSKRIPEIYILSGYVATVRSAKVKIWTCTQYHFRNLNFASGNEYGTSGITAYWVCRKWERLCASWCCTSPTWNSPARELSCNISMTSEEHMVPIKFTKEMEQKYTHNRLRTFHYPRVKMGIFLCLTEHTMSVMRTNLIHPQKTFKEMVRIMWQELWDMVPHWTTRRCLRSFSSFTTRDWDKWETGHY